MRAGKNLITIAIKGLPISLLPVNHTDSDVGRLITLRAGLPVCRIIDVHLDFLQLQEFSIQLI